MQNPERPLHILIATPSYDAKFTLAFTRSLFRLQKHLSTNKIGIELSFASISSPFIDMARNFYASWVLENKEFSHLLFVDQDHGFSPELVIEMVDFDKPVVGVVYPARKMKMDDVQSASITESDQLRVSFFRPPFVVNEQNKVEVESGFVRVKKLGTGIMLINRTVFERLSDFRDIMADNYQDLINIGLSGRLLQCFRPIIGDNNLPFGEDVSFCLRWTERCQGELWANITHETSHVGTHEFKGKFLDRLVKTES